MWKRLIYNQIDYGDFYLISDKGQVKNVKTNYVIKNDLGNNGYLSVTCYFGSRKNRKRFLLHKALAETFIPNLNNLPAVNHIDGNKLNCSLNNLEWCTISDNNKHAYANDLKHKKYGEFNDNSKLTWNDVNFIRGQYSVFYSSRQLATMFNVSKTTILDIIHNKTWKIE